MITELQEISVYEGFLKRVLTINPENQEQIADTVAMMYESAQLNQISTEMHHCLCELLSRKTIRFQL